MILQHSAVWLSPCCICSEDVVDIHMLIDMLIDMLTDILRIAWCLLCSDDCQNCLAWLLILSDKLADIDSGVVHLVFFHKLVPCPVSPVSSAVQAVFDTAQLNSC